jgi:hypothetical protein
MCKFGKLKPKNGTKTRRRRSMRMTKKESGI